MQALDNRFFEEYKRLEKLCSDLYGEKNGVSAYIADMERRDGRGRTGVSSWSADYKMLKHVRWVRNRLAHDPDAEQVGEAGDLAFVRDFCRRIIAGQDPLAELEKAERKVRSAAGTRQTARAGAAKDPRPQTRTPGKKRRLLPVLLGLEIAVLLLLIGMLVSGQGGALLDALRELISAARG